MLRRLSQLTIFIVAVGAVAQTPQKNKLSDSSAKIAQASAKGTLWVDPSDIKTRDLLNGAGGKAHQPGTTFTFVDEDKSGTNPKFDVKDQDGVKWKVKLGAEAQPETAASRLVWAVGYYVNEDYFVPKMHVTELPNHLHRGQSRIVTGGEVDNARLKRHMKGEEKAGTWKWRDDPFEDTREWNGLRVMMALLNNWDLKDENNAIYDTGSDRIYMVSDLGASFGTTGYNPKQTTSKGNLHNYEHSGFLGHISSDYVDFHTPSRPAMIVFFNPVEFFPRMKMRWIGHHVPRSDARWMGQMLAKLSPEQIRDAFRAAGYSTEQTEGFAQVVERRIAALVAL